MQLFNRHQILSNLKDISTQGGVYFWYVTKEGAQKLNLPIEGCTELDGMYLVYIGLSRNLRMRMKWHNGDDHRLSAIKSGLLSIVRQKISSLLCNNWHSREEVDNFMDNHMRVRYQVDLDYKKVEEDLIKSHVLPLNYKHNEHPFKKTMSKLNSQSKKNSLIYFNLITN